MLNPPSPSLSTPTSVVPLEEEDILRKIRRARNIRLIENILTGPIVLIHAMNLITVSLCAAVPDEHCPSSLVKSENSEFSPFYLILITFGLTGLLMGYSIHYLWHQVRNWLKYVDQNSDLVLEESVRSVRCLAKLSIVTLLFGVTCHLVQDNGTWVKILSFGVIYKFYVVAACQGYLNLFDGKETPIPCQLNEDSQIRDDQPRRPQVCHGYRDLTNFYHFTNDGTNIRDGLVVSHLLQPRGNRNEVVDPPPLEIRRHSGLTSSPVPIPLPTFITIPTPAPGISENDENPPTGDPPCYESALLARADSLPPPTYREAMSVLEDHNFSGNELA
ncbi:uncharacterized protein LOC118437855 [Folsomia candida]|uniref:uncharacterized protein LOC118437855 n=1 Tax=Folsomia candida TaxID=158441 RepID=UPI001604D8DB|nr:uncharacterized protein LOC118437855 [Folsomia candida]XP_035713141.1 uncharacterized protein LOC118437855 [Folsomia candida]